MTDFAARRDTAVEKAYEHYHDRIDSRNAYLRGAFSELLDQAIAEIERLEKLLAQHHEGCECLSCHYDPEQGRQAEELRL